MLLPASSSPDTPYHYQQPSTRYHHALADYKSQSLAYAMTINPAEVNVSRAPPSQEVEFDSLMTSDEPEKEEQVDSSAKEDGNQDKTVMVEETKPVLPPPPRADQPPRPPNAWILYRSERLRAIAAGEPIPGLLAVLEAQSLVRALDVSEQRNQGSKDSSSSPEPNRFQLFKDTEPPTPSAEKDDAAEEVSLEGGSKYRRALLQADISKVISMMWKREGREVKAKYEAMAEAKKQEHQRKYPNYKYQPMRKEEKLKYQEQVKAEKERVKKEAMADKAQQRKLAKAARQFKAAQDKSIAHAIKSPGENNKKSRHRRQLPQSSHLLTIPLSSPNGPQEDGTTGSADFGPVTPLVEYKQILPEQSQQQVLIKQEPDEQSYFIQVPTEHQIQNTQFSPQYSGAGVQFTQLPPAQPMYRLHPCNYPLPNTQPGFIVQQDQVIPYTFEPIQSDQYYSEAQRHPVQPQYMVPYTDLSSKSQPAVATMSSAEYQHVGVSEAELAEMWAMLEDDNVPAGQQQNLQVKPRLATTVGSGQIDEDSMEHYSRLPGPADEQGQEGIPLPRLSSFVGSQIAMSWVGQQNNNSHAAEETKSSETTPTARTTSHMPQMPRSTHVENDTSSTPRATRQNHSRFATAAPISINAAKAQAYQYRPRKDSLLAGYKPLSPIDGVLTPRRSVSAFPLDSYHTSEFWKGERRPSENSYLPYPQSFPNDFSDQPNAYEYRFLTPRTAMFRDTMYAPMSMSAPSERWDGLAWHDSLPYQGVDEQNKRFER